MFAGGIADKLGNRYEAIWLVRQLLDVLGGKAQSLRYEGVSSHFDGFEAAVNRSGVIEWHQTKINSPNGNWTIAALAREGVLAAFRARFSGNPSDVCIFVSQDPARDLRALAEKATIASDSHEFVRTLPGGHTEKFKELQNTWGVDSQTAFAWLRRSEFRTESQTAIESVIAISSEFYFFKGGAKAFETLREFLETHINKDVTTEFLREHLRSGDDLTLKDWSLDPTLKERLSRETAAYLQTYIPFGAGGSTVPRREVQLLMDRLNSSPRPTVVLLTGVAGSGKSGVIREFIGRLVDDEISHLALRIDHHLDCSSAKSLGQALVDRDESPITSLKGVTPSQVSVLIVDQVDAVSEVSGRNGAVKQTVLRLVDDALALREVFIVIACRTFDLETDQRLKVLKDTHGVEHIDVSPLTWETDVKPLLLSRAIDAAKFTDKQRELLCLPLNLTIFLSTSDGTEPQFRSRNDLFAKLLDAKNRSVRTKWNVGWDILDPLSSLANWMSEEQSLDAPESVLSKFGGALDILSSEALIVRSRDRVNFFHESFFDYIYARTFVARRQSLLDLLTASEQHLFRRTQVRQILETLRQLELPGYLHELRSVISADSVRYHVKLAVVQWLGSLADPTAQEQSIINALDKGSGAFPTLLRHSFLASVGWFDRLCKERWITTELERENPERTERILWWLSEVADQRADNISKLLEAWWGDDPQKGRRLLDWFSLTRGKLSDGSLISLCCRLIRSNSAGLFDGRESTRPDILLGTWTENSPTAAGRVLKAYYESWFEHYPNAHPFGRVELRDIDTGWLNDLAEKAPEAFLKGMIDAFIKSIEVILDREKNGERDYSFKHRNKTGHHFGSDAFLNAFRSAICRIAKSNPSQAETFLRQLTPERHEAFTHLWLEAIAANGEGLSHLFTDVLNSPHLFDAGWQGAKWKSFADATKAIAPFLVTSHLGRTYKLIGSHNPEHLRVIAVLRDVRLGGEQEPWRTRRYAAGLLADSGREQWCVLEVVGEHLLDATLKQRLQQLRRKFKGLPVPEPFSNEAHWVQSPIRRDQAKRMTDEQWLRAIDRYNSDHERRRVRTFVEGGASQLAGELQHLAKEQPIRSVTLLEKIPANAHPSYISQLLWGLSEAGDLGDSDLKRAIHSSHNRPGNPYGREIVRLIERHPHVADDPAIFAILAWYVEHGDVSPEETADHSDQDKEARSISDLINRADRMHVKGLNEVRGSAAEVLGAVIWELPTIAEQSWKLVEQRASDEPAVSVRCCLMRPTIPLYNSDRERCARLTEQLSRPSRAMSEAPTATERMWLRFAFPSGRLPTFLAQTSVYIASKVERLLRKRSTGPLAKEGRQEWLPLVSSHGVYLLPFLLHSTPDIGKRLIYRLLVQADDTARLIGAWHVFRQSFQDAGYAPLADALLKSGVTYRRLNADVASFALTSDEYRTRAEKILRDCFADADRLVRSEAAEVFRNIKPDEFVHYRDLAFNCIASEAFRGGAWAFCHAIAQAECKVDDIVISATELLVEDIEKNGDAGGRRMTDLHRLQDMLQKEYASSDGYPDLRRRLLDLIDRMLKLELYGADKIVNAHER